MYRLIIRKERGGGDQYGDVDGIITAVHSLFSNYFWWISFPLKILFRFKETFKHTFTQKPSSLIISWVLLCNLLFWTLLEPFLGGRSAVTFQVEENQCDRRRLFLFSFSVNAPNEWVTCLSNSYRKAKGGKAGFRGLLWRTWTKRRCDLTQASKEKKDSGRLRVCKRNSDGSQTKTHVTLLRYMLEIHKMHEQNSLCRMTHYQIDRLKNTYVYHAFISI